MKLRCSILALTALLALAIVGCGGGGDDGGATDPAAAAPALAPVFIDLTIQPKGQMKEYIEELAESVGAIQNLGDTIILELEESAEAEDLVFERDVLPWLGEKGGLFLQEYEDEDFEGYGAAIQVTDEDAAREFIEEEIDSEDKPAKDGSYEGVDFKVQADDGTTVGVFDGLVVFAEDEAIFKSMVDAADGENLAGEDAYSSAASDQAKAAAADVYVNIGALIEEAGEGIDPDAKLFLDSLGIEPEEATAFASIIPREQLIEVDFSTDLNADDPPSGDPSEMLGSMPEDSVAALASTEFGSRFGEAIDQIDAEGIEGEVPPDQLKKTLKQAGVDLDAIASSVGDGGLFVRGLTEKTLSGALVLETDDAGQAKNTVSNIGLFLRKAGTPGVTAVTGKASGFSVRSPDLGRQPIVVAARGNRVAIGYGLESTLAGLDPSQGTLANPSGSSTYPSRHYKYAKEAFGDTPISVFLDGWEGFKLASSLLAGDEGFEEAAPFVRKINWIALGSESSGDLLTAKLMIGV